MPHVYVVVTDRADTPASRRCGSVGWGHNFLKWAQEEGGTNLQGDLLDDSFSYF